MKLFCIATFALAATSPGWAASPAFLIDFEKSWDFANGDVAQYYNGGAAADGSVGPNLGVSFVGISGLSNDADFTYYRNAPSMLGTAYAYGFGPLDRAFMNVAAGVDGALAFSYASPVNIAAGVKAYAGLDGTGSLLGSFNLASNGAAYDAWTPVTFRFAGTARSFDFSSAANVAAFDNIRVSAVPEPGMALLTLAGAACMLGRRRRSQA